MRYFLTGATGFIGGRLARRLRAAGHEVHALVRTPASEAKLRAEGIVPHLGDVTDRRSVQRAMRNADGVFHMAAWYRLGAPDRAMAERVNVMGTRNVLEVMRELGSRAACTRARSPSTVTRAAGSWTRSTALAART